jgi:Type VI secretion system/phage-baseplate injector OB domain
MIKDDYGNRRFFGIYRGVVHDNNDPQKKRRIRVKVPQVLQDEPTQWIWHREDSYTKTQPPATNQGVWVMFEGGDPSFPVSVGTFGKNVESTNYHTLITPITSTQLALTGVSSYLKTATFSDGTTELDLIASLVAMAQKLVNHETRLASLESQLTTLHTTLASRTTSGHTHTSNG